MSGYHSLHATRLDDGHAVRYHLPLAAEDCRALRSGHRSLIVTLRQRPPSLSNALLPAGTRFMPADFDVRQVPLLVPTEVPA
jgi:hypothetical protein